MNQIKIHKCKNDFYLESGASISNLQIAYHTYGKINAAEDNIIWVFHALTASSDVLDWWQGLFGEKDLFSPERYFIICANVLGSPYGSTQPSSLDFPQFSVRDIVAAHYLLAKELGIVKISVAIGGSFGGNQALEFAYGFEGQIAKLILVASSAKESAWSIAVHETQRMAMRSDKTFGQAQGGNEGMAAARAIGMLTYRTSEAFIETQTDQQDKLDDFRASSYIQYQGEKFIKRFNALSYYYLSKCLDTHNVGRVRGGVQKALEKITIPTLVIGIDSDLLIPPALQEEMVAYLPNGIYKKIKSEFGHDGFLVETEKISSLISEFLNTKKLNRSVLKFGGSSLKNGTPITRSLAIIERAADKQPIVLVVSARGKTTDSLVQTYEHAVAGEDFSDELAELIKYQTAITDDVDFGKYKKKLHDILAAVKTLGTEVPSARDKILAQGELMSAESITAALVSKGRPAVFVDSRRLIVTHLSKGETTVDHHESRRRTQAYFSKLDPEVIPVVTGFIAADEKGITTNLGRNGSNYSATLIATYISASEVQNWTDVNGVYSAHPKYVKTAVQIPQLSYREANELANFGASVLHSKTILPLMKTNIPLKIYNSYSDDPVGTLINKTGSGKGIKAISLIENVSLVSIEGMGLSGKVGIDSRIFSALSNNNISVRLISQASSERDIGFVINSDVALVAEQLLREEFQEEVLNDDISNIKVNSRIAIIAITGRHNYALEKAVEGLRRNKIWIHLFSNSISGENISLVISSQHAHKALNIVHEYVLAKAK